MEMTEVGGGKRLPSFRSCRPNARTPKVKRRGASKGDVKTSSPCASPRSSPSSIILDRVILARSPAVRFGDEAGHAEYSKNDFVLESLQWHNYFRVKHRVSPLILSEQLCNLAQFWCNHLAHNNTFYHRNLKDVGENLFCRCSPGDIDVTGEQIAKYWYDEVKSYNFKQEPSTLHVNAGHFSQLIWRSSREFGIGKAHTRCGKLMVVANYRPAGNIIGLFQNNVFPLSDQDDELEALDELEGMMF